MAAIPPPPPPDAVSCPLDCFSQQRDFMLQELEAQVERALVLLDDDVVCEYRQAMSLAPQLVAREARIAAFLQTENYHPLLAAKRLALYWKRRKELYGTSRWLRPLAQTGRGCLTAEQGALVRTGFQVVVTAPQAVFIFDLARLPTHVNHFQPQVMFYLLSTASNNSNHHEPSTLQDMTILHVVQDGYRPLVLPQAERLKQLSECLPYRIQNILVVQVPNKIGKEHLLEYRSFEQERICHANTQIVPEAQRATVNCLRADSLKDMLALLQAKGLHASVIPECLGGTYSYEHDFVAWIRTRLSLEEMQTTQLPTAPSVAAVDTNLPYSSLGDMESLLTGPALSGDTTIASGSSSSSLSFAPSGDVLVRQAPGETDEEFGRRRNAVYTKRFLSKQKWHQAQLHVKVTMLQQLQATLLTEHTRLSQLWNQAQRVVAEHQEKLFLSVDSCATENEVQEG